MIEKWLAETDIRFPDSTQECIVPPKRIVYLGKLGGEADIAFMKASKDFEEKEDQE